MATSHSLPEGPVGFEERANLDFPVVGIGASAGGLEALSKFFQAAPIDSGMSFVVIQHLPPDHTTLMPDILSRCTAMPVKLIEDGMAIGPNSVYVIRPGFTVTLANGLLRLGRPVEERGHRHPVDDLFRSLALEQKEKSIAVVLSGTGTNGTAGAQAVKAAGGLCVAQDPNSAEFSGMPRSLIRSGYADQIMPAEDIPPFLARFTRHAFVADAAAAQANAEAANRDRAAVGEIMALLRLRTGHDFRGYRKPTLLRRIQRRMGVTGAAHVTDYAQIMREKQDEAVSLANDLMINVTGFFRDPDAWEALREAAIAPLVQRHSAGVPIRAWVTACSSGEEPYSLAMLIAEECHRLGKPFEAKIFATDTAEKSLALARAGLYPAGIEGDISQERLERFFHKDEHNYRIKKQIRDAVIFASHNLLRDAPFSRLDICTCRNFLIYLERETQRQVLARLSFAVRDGGYLLLGRTESLGEAEERFETISKRWRIHRRVGRLQHRMSSSALPASEELMRERSRATATVLSARDDRATLRYERALLDEFAPPTVIIDHQQRVLFVHGEITPFLTFPAGELTTDIADLVRAPMRAAVRAALRRATQQVTSVDTRFDTDTGALWVRVTAARLKASAAARHMRVSFEMIPAPEWSLPATDSEKAPSALPPALPLDAALEDDLRVLHRELQASIDAYETSNQELESANGAVLSVGEELQSAKEELDEQHVQSINEEFTNPERVISANDCRARADE